MIGTLISYVTCGGPLLLLKVRRTCLFSPGSRIALLSFKAPRSFTPLFECVAWQEFHLSVTLDQKESTGIFWFAYQIRKLGN
jgi:hypothetical protein